MILRRYLCDFLNFKATITNASTVLKCLYKTTLFSILNDARSFFTAVDQGRSNSLTDVQQSSEELFRDDKPRSRPSSGRRSSTPAANNKPEPFPGEFVGK